MKHLIAMSARLPALYRHGALLQGLLTQPALQQMIVDEDLTRIQQAHFFELTRDFDEVVMLSDLLGLKPEPESGLREFRSFVAAFRDAIRHHGTTTPATIRAFVSDHLTRFQRKTALSLVPNPQTWRDQAGGNGYPALVENPPQRRILTLAPDQAGTPLQPFNVENQSLEKALLAAILTADDDMAEVSPCLVNFTTGQGLLYRGILKPGQRLWLKPEGDNSVRAFLEHRDVSDRLRGFSGWIPGQALGQDGLQSPAAAMQLAVGTNTLSFFPLAQFDQAGLDRFLLAMPNPDLAQGRFNQGMFNQALFHQDRRIRIKLTWIEQRRATFQVRLPMAAMLRDNQTSANQADHARSRLLSGLNRGVSQLKAAGVAGTVKARVHREGQRQMDFLTMIMPIRLSDGGVIGKARKVYHGASFDYTLFDDSLMV